MQKYLELTSISIHSLRVEGDIKNTQTQLKDVISIHSLRVEGDLRGVNFARNPPKFQSTPSVWRETTSGGSGARSQHFNPLPPCGGRRASCAIRWRMYSISIHSLRVEGDVILHNLDC